MTQEDKELLLKDLSARLKYGVYIRHGINGKSILTGIERKKHPKRWIIIAEGPGFYLNDIKPYLRPMLSMTEEEKEELKEICSIYIPTDSKNIGFEDYGILVFTHHLTDNSYSFKLNLNVIDWLLAHHFDYRGLIEKGLALEAPDGMYNIK